MSDYTSSSFDRSIFPDFDNIEKIGIGGFSSVYSAFHKITKRNVAIKHVLKSRLDTETNIRNFHREIEIMKIADHPFIAHFFELIETEESYYIIMEFAPGGTLLSKINSKGELQVKDLQRIFSQLASAVHYLQTDLKIVHRDLKLENILFDENDNVRLIDFGLSCKMQTDEDKFKTLCGSYPYAAPEIFHQEPYSNSVDVWSLGVCLYAASVGRLPFYNSNTSKLIQSIVKDEPIYPFHLQPLLTDLIRKMLIKDPKERLTILEVINHPFFTDSPMQFYMDYHRFTVTPNEKTGLDPEIAHKLLEVGLNPKESIKIGTKAYLVYRILRTTKVSVMMCHESEFVQSNPIQHKFSAPTIKYQEPLLRKFNNSQYNRNVSSINKLSGSHLSRMRNSSLNTNKDFYRVKNGNEKYSRLKCPRPTILIPQKY